MQSGNKWEANRLMKERARETCNPQKSEDEVKESHSVNNLFFKMNYSGHKSHLCHRIRWKVIYGFIAMTISWRIIINVVS